MAVDPRHKRLNVVEMRSQSGPSSLPITNFFFSNDFKKMTYLSIYVLSEPKRFMSNLIIVWKVRETDDEGKTYLIVYFIRMLLAEYHPN